jgi:chromate transporter
MQMANKTSVQIADPNGHQVSFREAAWTWARVAALSFGGPAGQIAVMHRILVEEKRWIGEERFLHALNYCMLLPGPEAHQLAVYIGWLLHRIRGGILSGTLFVLPGLVSLSLLSWIYAVFGSAGPVAAAFFGLKAAVLAVVLEAIVRVGKRALKTNTHFVIASAAFVALFCFAAPFPLVILAAGVSGFVLHRFVPDALTAVAHGASAGAVIDDAFARAIPAHVKPSARRFALVALVGGTLWLGPVVVLYASHADVFAQIGAFNAKMAVVTFGGAYAVLAYMAQQAVETYHWLKPSEMLVGLGFAETTPGPLISVVDFVGFLAAFRAPGALAPTLAGLLGGALAMWTTFVPSFLWIFLGGPYVESLIGNKSLNAALSAITAAVVGVILNLAVWLWLHTLFGSVTALHAGPLQMNLPVLSSVNWPALLLSLGAVVAMLRFKTGMIATLFASSALGVAYFYLLATFF